MFQRRHYEALAKALGGSIGQVRRMFAEPCADTMASFIEEAVADLFADDNPNFHAERFHGAVRKAEGA